jgi:hypothetical membrane protein
MGWIMTAGWLLLLVLPFVVSLFGKAQMPRLLCFVCSVMAILLGIFPYEAMLPWTLGMAIAVMSVRERIRSAYGL